MISLVIDERWDELEKFLELYNGELLGIEAENLINFLINNVNVDNEEEANKQKGFLELGKLLNRCKENGIKTACVELKKTCAECDFKYTIGKISQLLEPEEMNERANLCRQALKLIDIIDYGQNKSVLCALLKFELGESLSQIPTIDPSNNIENAINAYFQALDIVKPESDEKFYVAIMLSLGSAYHNRIIGDKAENLEQSILIYKRILTTIDKDNMPDEWGKTNSNLGNVYRVRIKGDLAQNIEDSINYHNQALEVFKSETKDWSIAQMNLGNAYRNRQYGIKAENIHKSIQSYLLALDTPIESFSPIDWAKIWLNLGIAYGDCQGNNRVEYLNKAIKAFENSLKILSREKDPLLWSITKVNQGATYLEIAEICNPENMSETIEKSIKTLNLALEELTFEGAPDYWGKAKLSLGTAYRLRLIENKDNFVNAKKAYLDALKVFNFETFPDDCRRVARSLGDLLFDNNYWEEAIDVYLIAINATEKLYEESLLRMGKEKELVIASDLYHLAAYATAQINSPKEAIVLLERGRARWLNESLERDRSNIEKLKTENPEAFEKYLNAAIRGRELEEKERKFRNDIEKVLSYEELNSISKQAQEIKVLMEEAKVSIRLIPGYESFLRLPEWKNIEEIITNCANDVSIIYLVTTAVGSFALISYSPENSNKDVDITTIWLDKFKEHDLSKLLADWFFESKKVSYDFPAWYSTIDRTLNEIWDFVMGPLVITLQEKKINKVIIVPTGFLGLLPLHAAWREEKGKRRYALDNIAFSYIPSARSLYYAKHIAETTSRPESLLAIKGPKLSKDSYEEIEQIYSMFDVNKTLILNHDETNLSEIMAELTKHQIAHFLCHGKFNFDNPRKSCLNILKDDVLTMDDLLELNIPGARMAILSACETGIPDHLLPDEVISLPSALLHAGFAGTIASLWSVSQKSTTELMSRFYHQWINEGKEPSIALRDAQIDTRDNSNEYSHPFYWAAFYLTGV